MDKDTRIRLGASNFSVSGSLAYPVIARCGRIEHSDKFGTDLAISPIRTPDVAEYDEWLKSSRNRRIRGGNSLTIQQTGFRLRRIVIMRRQGETWEACGEAVGVKGYTARAWVEFLPLHLAV